MEKVILFGASELGKKAFKEFKGKYDIKYFCDNDNKKVGTNICGVEVISPNEMKNLNFQYKIIISSSYYNEIAKQLNRLNISNYDYYLYSTPMLNVIKGIQEKNMNIGSFRVLEVFGGRGEYHTLDYCNKVRSLDVWEINGQLEADLRRNLPKANVKIADSFKEISSINKKYDMIVIDNSPGVYGGHCEHFDLLPQVYNVIKDEAILILNVVPKRTKESDEYKSVQCFNEEHNIFRKIFYNTSNPENISMEYMKKVYEKISELNNYFVEWSFSVKRTFIYYLVLKVKRIL
ncbi:hypothetical protein [Clostridium botulinum]|uniref:hypothetical protein n=1 Tax=Clostridium botulinum TaxID=1491 RepID=UPI0006A72FB5|nr:hypothetical protein [Clostridium botulinum]KON08804.1 hypothetical protein ACP52_14510 [Clostridium botulinum]MBN3362237.1 hypothetical protein [Clostridium botulinum]MBY6898429.1 hypothetical protein [Clostridium botulinum]MBY6906052.1 hypothetical protein [Clostridium botulinum]MBY6912944.1 hypothetical protein [Clostridium botulinum]